ncbi:Transcriptional regulatory protein DegU [compost metagenome]
MTPISGLNAAEIILKNSQTARILFLTTFADDEYIIKALKIGAKGYILKQDFESIIPALKAVYSGQTVFGDDIMSKIPILFNSNTDFEYSKFDLTEKEYKIIKLISDGYSNKEIGSILFLSDGTIRNTISVILEKLSLRDRTQIAIFYYKNI